MARETASSSSPTKGKPGSGEERVALQCARTRRHTVRGLVATDVLVVMRRVRLARQLADVLAAELLLGVAEQS